MPDGTGRRPSRSIHTAHAVAGVRGTDFVAIVSEKDTRFLVQVR